MHEAKFDGHSESDRDQVKRSDKQPANRVLPVNGAPAKKTGLRQIAEHLGLSMAAVSMVLNDVPLAKTLTPATRARILKAAKEFKYRPNLTARSLATGRSSLIGMVVPDLTHPFFGEICKSVSLALRDAGYFLIVSSSNGNAQLEQQEIEQMLAHKLDALIVASSRLKAGPLRALAKQRTSLILVDRFFTGFGCHFVGTDDYRVGAIATEHLVRGGRKRIAHIRGPHIPLGDLRFRGFSDTLAAHGLALNEKYVIAPEFVDTGGRRQGQQVMKALLALRPHPDAVFCINDDFGIGAIEQVLASGLRVPDDVAIIGCGNYSYSDTLRVPLTSVEQFAGKIGQEVAAIILDLITSEVHPRPWRRVVLEPSLIVRESTGS